MRFHVGVIGHDAGINIGNLEESDRPFEEGIGGFFVSGVEGARHCSTGSGGLVGEFEADEGVTVGLFEREVGGFDRVPGVEFVGGSFGKEQRILNGESHIGPAQLGKNACIFELNQTVDDALGVDNDIDLIDRDAEQPLGFDDFQPFVHEAGGIDGDFAAHPPSGVGEDIFG